MGQRVNLQLLLEEILGSENVYFQPPASISIQYPCIIYGIGKGVTVFADNKSYMHRQSYSVKVIDKNPDSEIPSKIATLALCLFDRHYTASNLNHYIYNLYY